MRVVDDLWTYLSQAFEHAAVKGAVKGVILGAIAGATFLLTRRMTRHGDVALSDAAGHTVQSPKLIVVAGLCGVCAVAFLLWGILDPASLAPPGADGWWFGLVAGFALLFLLLAMLSTQRWSWDSERFVWHGAFGARTILWRDLVSAGPTWEGQFAARDAHGVKIRWSTYTLEYDALTRIAQAHLAPPKAAA